MVISGMMEGPEMHRIEPPIAFHESKQFHERFKAPITSYWSTFLSSEFKSGSGLINEALIWEYIIDKFIWR